MPQSNRVHLRIASDPSADVGQPAPGVRTERLAARRLLRVGDLARATGKTVRALHHYEELGLLKPAERSKGGYRLYHPETPTRIRWIAKLNSLGISLTELQEMVQRRRDSGSAQASAEELRGLYEGLLSAVRERLGEMQKLQSELESSLEYLEACGTLCTPLSGPSECASCERFPEASTSDLITGAMS